MVVDERKRGVGMTNLENVLGERIDSVREIQACRILISRYLVKQYFLKESKTIKLGTTKKSVRLHGVLASMERNENKTLFKERLIGFLHDLELINERILSDFLVDDSHIRTKTILKNIEIYQHKGEMFYYVKKPHGYAKQKLSDLRKKFKTLEEAVCYRNQIIDKLYEDGVIKHLDFDIHLGARIKERHNVYGEEISYVVTHHYQTRKLLGLDEESVFNSILEAIDYELSLRSKSIAFKKARQKSKGKAE